MASMVAGALDLAGEAFMAVMAGEATAGAVYMILSILHGDGAEVITADSGAVVTTVVTTVAAIMAVAGAVAETATTVQGPAEV